MEKRYAKRSILSGSTDPYECRHEWPSDCYIQCGGRGLVLDGEDSYRTAFFEAFPRDPDTFIRGEGSDIKEAEKNAWEKYQRISQCDHPEFERRNYRNGLGFCVDCGMSKSKAFEPLEKCCVCGEPTFHDSDWNESGTGKDWYCEKHNDQSPGYEHKSIFYGYDPEYEPTDEEWKRARVYILDGPEAYKKEFGDELSS